MPPTTGGSTSGSRTNPRITDIQRKGLRASTTARGTPSTRHNAVAAAEVRRLNASASRDAGDVTSDGNVVQSTVSSIDTRGTTTNSNPSAAGTNNHRGSPVAVTVYRSPHRRGLPGRPHR